MRDVKQMEQKESAEKLSHFGVRPLSHRVAIYRYLMDNKNHPTADTIYTDLKGSMPSLSRTTVYNVLNHLCEKGAVRKVSIEEHESRYDADISDHIHFKCMLCKKVYDLVAVPFPEVKLPANFTSVTTQVNIEGICPDCS